MNAVRHKPKVPLDHEPNPTESNTFIEEVKALAAYRLAKETGTVTRVPQAEVRRRLGLESRKKPEEDSDICAGVEQSELIPCGSKSAYQRHLDRGEKPDELCKKANRDYTNEFNRRTGTSRARNRAYRRLAKTFSTVFAALLEEEKSRAKEERPGAPARVWYGRARERAHRRLANLYSDIFQRILQEEKAIARNETRRTD